MCSLLCTLYEAALDWKPAVGHTQQSHIEDVDAWHYAYIAPHHMAVLKKTLRIISTHEQDLTRKNNNQHVGDNSITLSTTTTSIHTHTHTHLHTVITTSTPTIDEGCITAQAASTNQCPAAISFVRAPTLATSGTCAAPTTIVFVSVPVCAMRAGMCT